MIHIKGNEAYTDMPDTHRICRHGEEMYFTRTTLLAGETAEDFEEKPITDIITNEDDLAIYHG